VRCDSPTLGEYDSSSAVVSGSGLVGKISEAAGVEVLVKVPNVALTVACSQDEIDRGITIKSTAISMYFPLPKEDIADIKQKTEGECDCKRLELISQAESS
jgi:hypothetical protein